METTKNTWQKDIRNDEVERFNAEIATLAGPVDLEGRDLSNQDLRRSDLRTANLRHASLKIADLRGVDLSEAQMDGASINRAHISGAFFPRSIPAQEVWLSVEHGTRTRATP